MLCHVCPADLLLIKSNSLNTEALSFPFLNGDDLRFPSYFEYVSQHIHVRLETVFSYICDFKNRHIFLLSYYYGKHREVFYKFYRRHNVCLKNSATKQELCGDLVYNSKIIVGNHALPYRAKKTMKRC